MVDGYVDILKIENQIGTIKEQLRDETVSHLDKMLLEQRLKSVKL